MNIFVNRTLNMKKIKVVGFDMDYTLVRYKTENFERLCHQEALTKLVQNKHYSEKILDLKFEFNRVIQGLVIDKKRGNLLKTSRFGKVKSSYHGLNYIDFKEQQKIYRNKVIDLNAENYYSMDTSFSVSHGVLFAQLVDLKEKGVELPEFHTMADDIKEVIDIAHSDGTLKNEVKKNIAQYIIKGPETAILLERLKRYGKSLIIITNSEYSYTKLLLDYTITPFLKEHKDWTELFDITVTLSRKPKFFTDDSPFLLIDTNTGTMTNAEGKITKGVYQGGFAGKLQNDLGLTGDEILYLGDHIYGDVVTLKKTFNWRTALIVETLGQEIIGVKNSSVCQKRIDDYMVKKEELEVALNVLDLKKQEEGQGIDKEEINKLFAEIEKINNKISHELHEYRTHFNPYWGEMMRAGQEESRFADQLQKYACIYMAKVTDLLNYSPRTYFRPSKRILPHEF